jgi:hypothetical protein
MHDIRPPAEDSRIPGKREVVITGIELELVSLVIG